jgi:hypothetical protein
MLRKAAMLGRKGALAQRAGLRQERHFFAAAYNLAKKVTPKISPTEAAALDAGTIGFDRELFEGAPSLQNLKQKYDLKVRRVAYGRGESVYGECGPVGRGLRPVCWRSAAPIRRGACAATRMPAASTDRLTD